ncbi:MAG: hypothetical protein JWQ96_2221 [Segetibacter sp.]|nr:hypothetical protein [Segetibacter sp.]
MKTLFVPAVVALAMFTATSCDNSQTSETSTDSTTTGSTAASTGETSEATTSGTVTSSVTEGSYINLSTGKPVQVKKEESSGYAWDATLNEPIEFYISPATKDTFDKWGRVVNNYIVYTDDGRYTIDQNKWKTKVDSDGDFKAKDGEGNKIKYDESTGKVKVKSADGSKEKLKDDKYKSKTDTSKTVIRNH